MPVTLHHTRGVGRHRGGRRPIRRNDERERGAATRTAKLGARGHLKLTSAHRDRGLNLFHGR